MVFLKKHFLAISGIATGAFGGFLYWYFIGCNSGTCPITSNPTYSTIYGAVAGFLLFTAFKKEIKTTNPLSNDLSGNNQPK